MNRGERSWMRGFDRANSEPGFSDEDGEASKFYPLRFNNSEKEREGEEEMLKFLDP